MSRVPNLGTDPKPAPKRAEDGKYSLVAHKGERHLLLWDGVTPAVGAWYPLMCDSSQYVPDLELDKPSDLPECVKCRQILAHAILRGMSVETVVFERVMLDAVTIGKGSVVIDVEGVPGTAEVAVTVELSKGL